MAARSIAVAVSSALVGVGIGSTVLVSQYGKEISKLKTGHFEVVRRKDDEAAADLKHIDAAESLLCKLGDDIDRWRSVLFYSEDIVVARAKIVKHMTADMEAIEKHERTWNSDD